ncbi:hypothetical protein P152DRAFT_465221 [Eremomyces bilateralis CBS 781.70]|uniref:Methyltransferase n=1 Tax=Eremomyces bilateralis CBS 781.70 TaxID=1392243 RepID=A0A6G1G8B0_9PEZI|nr:uncharacterized protein P152DRAFT_465221 [Eremomyces bilateralis CBS 781.70]KAF1814345.1 hypothetical protein P152DRAFT_465221 [Eremomyces bilateralis CBS 781.70]
MQMQCNGGTRPQGTNHVSTEVLYYKDPGDGSPPPPAYVGQPNTFIRPPHPQDVLITDVSDDEDKYTLDSHGFAFVKNHPSAEKDFVDDAQIKAVYYPETEQLLKGLVADRPSPSTGATRVSRVFIFDHTIRRAVADDRAAPSQPRGPGFPVHIDQSYTALENRVWRPIKTILRDLLGLADAHSVPKSDLVPSKLIYPDRKGKTYSVRPNPAHRWYFKYAQRPDEPLFIKCYDSLNDGRARRVPHSAFVNPAHVNEPPRESIEVRALVFYDY